MARHALVSRLSRPVPLIAFLVILTALTAVAHSALRAGQGVQAQYTTPARWGTETHNRIDREISTAGVARAWRELTPEAFRVVWTGYLVIPETAKYTFATTSDDGSTLEIDGFQVVDNGGNHVPLTKSGEIRLPQGAHTFRLEYFQAGGGYEIGWQWARVGTPLTPVPAWATWTRPVGLARTVGVRIFSLLTLLSSTALIAIAIWAFWQRRRWTWRTLEPDWALLLILALGAWFRFQYIGLPLADAHGWRQIFNADVARNFTEQSLNILYPRVNWGGAGDPVVSMEFPLLQWIAAVFFRQFGELELICRLLSIAFSLATICGLYGLANAAWGRPVARGAAFLFAISPSAIFFGRAFISDTPMVCFSVFGVWGFAAYLLQGKRGAVVWGAAAAALACMTKLPAVVLFAPIAWLAWQTRGFGLVRDRVFLAGFATALLMTAAWYYHADVLFHRTGLGVAIFHGVGGYSPDIMEGSGTVTLVSSWNTLHQLRDPEFYWTLADRFWRLHFTPLGTIVILFTAAFLWRLPNRRFVDIWFASVLLFILAAAEGNRWHEFYQLPILLPAALYFGLGARPLFDGRLLGSFAPLKIGVAVSAALLTIVAFRSFNYSRAVPELFRPNNLRVHPMRVGTMLQRLTPPDALLITTEYSRFGGNSPVLLHYARRRGWSFDAGSITPAVIERLRTRYGARYFVSLNWGDIERLQPDVVAYLKKYVDIPVAAIDTRLYELSDPPAR